ncbi:MAG: hypothetical protein CVU84_10385 [Firmicutes bacterium HGW-Firmicutes-1]|nr:MAG: hypothetical protein CVU84_10385 [Firmicutes bacterium HGW-Firmicutes-1]
MQRVPDIDDYPDLPFDQRRRRRPRRRPPIGNIPGRPPQGLPQGPPQGPPGSPSGSMPQGPPPSRIPRRSLGGPSLYAVDPGAIWNCRYKYTYIWLEDGRSFWSWLVFVGRRSVAGYRWIGYGWVYFGTDLDNISDFVCY